ncbi:chromosomal replication initiator protein DnaA [Streptomyces sp. NBC_01637]|nr:chromosomal replication initiator protein DnaA [Streptomyces sp. NBC_01653]WTD88745.1 chromosomal replication initiator protein DnaA [Streptomyces sp. NBC_01637]
MTSLEPLGGHLPDESRVLADALRSIFSALGISVRRYAVRRHRDAGSISRFLNGTRIPPWDFVVELLNDVAEQQRAAPTPEAMEHLREMHRRALASSGSPAHRVQLLEDQLADADRQARRSAVRERALEDALLDTQHRAADLEVQIGQLHAHHDRDRGEAEKALQLHEDRVADLLKERHALMEQVQTLEEELTDAHERRIRADQRCAELERQLSAAESSTSGSSRSEDEAAVNVQAIETTHMYPRYVGIEENESQSSGTSYSRLNTKYLFDTFVIGVYNRFAHAAAVAVAEAPAKAYNPLFIYGESGLGKTHLLHAIGHYARSLYPGTRVRYVSSEEFTNEFINSIRDGKVDTFRKRYRDVDILLVDDIQFLASKESTQEEFFHTFNTLHNANKQIVLSSDRPPKQLMAMEDRLRNRFEWGLTTDVQPPELETRIAILRKKAVQEQLNAPPEVLEFIASRISGNIRELEGALTRIAAFASLNRKPVDLGITELVLRDFMPGGKVSQGRLLGDLIIELTCDYFGLTETQLRGRDRQRIPTTARQMAMHLCRELSTHTSVEIGSLFSGRDQSAVERADRKIRALAAERPVIQLQIEELTSRIRGAAQGYSQ